MTYDLLITAVSERADIFVECIGSLLEHVDLPPARLIVHEDVRPGSRPGMIADWLGATRLPYEHVVTDPARGLGPAMLQCFDRAATPVVLYTQEDWRALRTIPIRAALDLMLRHGLNHVRFNKRKTMAAKHADTPHPWRKMEVRVGEQTLCVSDHWYTQLSLWRVAPALSALREAAQAAQAANPFVARFNAIMNATHGDGRAWDDQEMRHERLRTYIWGLVGEPRFVEHMGSVRTTGPIVHVEEIARKGRRE